MAEPATPQTCVTVRFFAAARAATGVDEQEIPVSSSATVADVLAAAVRTYGAPLAQVLRRCSFLLGETAIHGTGTAVTGGDVLDVLPPFAGG